MVNNESARELNTSLCDLLWRVLYFHIKADILEAKLDRQFALFLGFVDKTHKINLTASGKGLCSTLGRRLLSLTILIKKLGMACCSMDISLYPVVFLLRLPLLIGEELLGSIESFVLVYACIHLDGSVTK